MKIRVRYEVPAPREFECEPWEFDEDALEQIKDRIEVWASEFATVHIDRGDLDRFLAEVAKRRAGEEPPETAPVQRSRNSSPHPPRAAETT